ncbi:MAG: hypothetical protein ISS25_02215 [Nanoarchaeota archaeon]|nr:hypothetical protein [DPANN group archaeon]MBL7116621.1 hypothetical protein [Nanoarchaeota archaeon]
MGEIILGKIKYIKDLERLFEKSPVVDVNSIVRLIRNKKNVKQYQKQLIRNLVLKGRIKKLVKGFYTMHNDPSLAVFCIKPSYLGLQDALSFHELWEQETIPVIITTRKVRPGIRKILGSNILIRRIDKKYVFGINYEKQGDFYFPYSDIEKTFIDMIYFKQGISQEVRQEIIKKINMKKLNSYLKVYPKRFRKRFI